LTRIILAITFLLFALPAFAQDTEQEDRSYFIGFVEDQLSTPNRQIRIRGIQGVLSSNATINEITIADREGVWLRITNARIVWTRSALLLGRLNIQTLAADSIDVLRRPLPEEGLPAPESGSFRVPELPLSVTLGALEVPRVSFGEDVFGLASQIALTGRLQLAGGSLDTALNVTRLDGPGGQLALTAAYRNDTQVLDLDLSLTEPENGIVANVLGIEGRPPVALTVAGQGPLEDLDLALTLDANAQRVLTGTTRLRQQSGGLGFTANVEGPIARLIPPRFREFFGAETTLAADGVFKTGGGLRLESLDLQSGALTVTGAAETTADNFLQRLTLDATVDNQSAEKVVLPIPGGETAVDRAALTIAFGESADENWTGSLTVAELATDTFAAQDIALNASGTAENINQPTERRVTFAVDGEATGITATRADIAEALGETIDLDIEGDWNAGGPIKLAKALLSGNGLSVSLFGDIAELAFRGDIAVDATSIAPFSQLAGREVSGGLDLDASGRIEPVTGGFDLTVDGVATGLTIDNPAADNLLQGETRITGRVARGETGLVADGLRIFNEQVSMTADGRFATGAADFNFDLALSDLGLVSEDASGRLTAKGRASGSDGLIGLTFGADVAEGSLVGKDLREAVLGFEGTLREGDLDGQVTGNAFLDGTRVQLASGVAIHENGRRLSGLNFTAGGTRITGDVTQNPAGLFDGALKLASADVSTAAALLLVQATGSVNADITLEPVESRQNATIKANADNLVVDNFRLVQAELQASIADLFNVPVANGSLQASDVTAAGIEVTRLSATAESSGTTTNFSGDATLDNGTTADASGALSPVDGGWRLGLQTVELAQGGLAARLLEPAVLEVKGQDISVGNLAFDVGGGRISAQGTIAQNLDLSVTIAALPLAIANTIRPDLGLGGTIDGTATIGGTRARPDIRFNVQGRSIAAEALRQAGLRTVSLNATGTSSAERLNVDAAVTSPDGLRATVRGGVPLGEGALALDVALEAFPLAVLNAAAPGRNLGGSLSGTARVTGTLARPAASFDLRGAGLRASALDAAGMSPLDATASGSFANQVLTLSSARVSGPQGLSLTANGRVPVSGSGVSITVDGQAPLSLANRFLAERGAQASGTVSLGATISGSLRQPAIRGTISTTGAQFIDPQTNIRLRDIAVSASLDGDRVTIRSGSAAIAAGGSLSVSGSVSTNAQAGFPADIRINLNQARYADGNLVVATLSGSLTLTGPLTRDPLVSGDIAIERAEITVPESLGAGAAAIDVIHIDPPRPVAETLQRARANDGTPTPTARPSVVRLNVAVSAPNRIFVRGRGLDAELGGTVRLTGPATDIQPVGAFNLIRGRLSILGQRITFDEGTVTLVGDLDPFVNFVARSGGNDITVFITVSGRVSDLDITFSSQPELPEDEVLARLIFNRSINELSPFQIAQLAAAAAELAGGSNTSLLGSLRSATGLDDIDIVTDAQGNPALRAGRYIQDNIYLGVEAGARGSTRATINLDITDNLKARGSVGAGGDSGAGIFYEKDY
jgi:translocation and assembly module TamB